MNVSLFTRRRIGLFGMLAVAGVVSQLFGDEPAAPPKSRIETADIAVPTDADLADKRIVFAKNALARFSIQVAGREGTAKVSDPCLFWSNPVDRVKDGVLAVYTFGGGRPVAVGQFFYNRPNFWINEFAIIAPDDTTILRAGQPFWKPREYVCKFADVPDAPVPAAKAPLRLSQMRKIAADFSVVDHFGWNDSEITRHDLRLLTQPIYRYAEEGKIIDGALFEFALGTDPECNLLLEAVEDEKGLRYRYALAPMSVYQLDVKYKDRDVWGIERRTVTGDKCTKYFAMMYRPEPGEIVPE
jgi:hypothetical protein